MNNGQLGQKKKGAFGSGKQSSTSIKDYPVCGRFLSHRCTNKYSKSIVLLINEARAQSNSSSYMGPIQSEEKWYRHRNDLFKIFMKPTQNNLN